MRRSQIVPAALNASKGPVCLIRKFRIHSGVVILAALQSFAGYGQAPKDASALALAQSSMAAMGAENLTSPQPVLMSGTLTLYGNLNTETDFPITIKTLGTTLARTELTTASGVRITTFSNGLGQIVQPSGSVHNLTASNTAGFRNPYLPVTSILSEYASDSISIENIGQSTYNGSAVNVIALSIWEDATAADAAQLAQESRTVFFLDQATGVVLKIQQQHFPENSDGSPQTLEIQYSDYRQVNGILVPFRQQTWADGTLVTNLQLVAVDLTASISVSDFSLAQ